MTNCQMSENSGVAILGSTGSIGTQALDVCERLGLRPCALAAGRNGRLLEAQARRYRPDLVALWSQEAARDLKVRLGDTSVQVLSGMEGLLACAQAEGAGTVVTAVVGNVGLRPTLAAVDQGKRIALANKETLVCAGELVLRRAEASGAEILPVDSEHSAIFQCLKGGERGEVEKILLTASGGPFRGKSREELKHVTLQEALNHPNWSMGKKITVDSATLLNKGLEFIEAMRLYRMEPEKIQVVVHPESVIHSMVEFRDHSILAQLAVPDMRLPIQYALTYPRRAPAVAQSLDLFGLSALHFCPPDLEAFPGLAAAMAAAREGGSACVALNGANEAAVDLFLREKIGFLDIADLVGEAVAALPKNDAMTLEKIEDTDRLAREFVYSRSKLHKLTYTV